MNVEYFIEASGVLSRHVRMDLKFNLYLYGHLNDIGPIDSSGNARPHGAVLHQLQAGLRYKLLLQLADYVYQNNPNERRIVKLLSFAESNIERIPWKTMPSRLSLKEQRDKLDATNAQIDRLRHVRNKYFAHVDCQYVIDPDGGIGEALPSIEDLAYLLNNLASILIFIDRYLGRKSEIGYDAWFDAECRQFTENLVQSMISNAGSERAKPRRSRRVS